MDLKGFYHKKMLSNDWARIVTSVHMYTVIESPFPPLYYDSLGVHQHGKRGKKSFVKCLREIPSS